MILDLQESVAYLVQAATRLGMGVDVETLASLATTSIVCKMEPAPTEPYAFFGGGRRQIVTAPNGEQHLVDEEETYPVPSKNSAYGNLPRPAILSSHRSCNLNFKDADINKIIRRLWDGDCVVAYLSDMNTFLFGFTPDEESVPKRFRGALIMLKIIRGDNAGGFSFGNDNACIQLAWSFTKALPVKESQKGILVRRLLHLFLRQHGTFVLPDLLNAATTALTNEYQSKQALEQCMDILMVQGDICLTLERPSKTLGLAMVEIGELLEANGEFKTAAYIYLEAFEHHYCKTTTERFKMYEYAGLAFKRAKIYDLAEGNYVKAFHYLVTSTDLPLDFNGPESDNLLTNYLNLQHILSEFRKSKADAHSVRGDMYVRTLSALLYLSGFKAATCGDFGRSLILQCGPANTALLHKNHRTPKGARKALEAAAQAGTTPTGFHQKVLDTLLDTHRKLVMKVNTIIVGEQVNGNNDAAQEALDKDRALQHIVENGGSSTRVLHGCNFCGQRETVGGRLFMKCPCKLVYYCQKSCQVSDWKDHKNFCKEYAKKKKTKKNNTTQAEENPKV